MTVGDEDKPHCSKCGEEEIHITNAACIIAILLRIEKEQQETNEHLREMCKELEAIRETSR